ncbi:MAG: AmmeMemoRadiSam system protein B [Candidatus Lambdaproteobacteria bacterium RIFOXYD12_FULL_49_8]|nr:MAG: AmmeMemoRadiSam system protein B [Candidatus Lambdaproteobacteria bacterium RIFOXYD12_FULL_49_8]
MKVTRRPAVAGSFYPADPEELKAEVLGYLNQAAKTANHAPRFLIVPHAGYFYSGAVAGAAFEEVRGQTFEQIILLGPSHRYTFMGAAATLDQIWQCPLGDFTVTRPNQWPLSESKWHALEHCLEVQLPFLSQLFPNAKLFPFLLSGSLEQAPALAKALQTLDSPETLWVISTDFSHVGPDFGYSPKTHGFASGEAMDKEAIGLVATGDRRGFKSFVERYHATICGALPVLTAMEILKNQGLGPFSFKQYDSSQHKSAGPNAVGYAAFYV